MTGLSVERRALLRKRLEEAEDALHLCAMGQTAKVFVDQTGERIEYGPASMGQLNKYIFTLKVSLGIQVTGPAEPWM